MPVRSTFKTMISDDLLNLLNIDMDKLSKCKLSDSEEQNLFKLIAVEEKPNLLSVCRCDCKLCSSRG